MSDVLPVTKTKDGYYIFTINLNHTPDGFEDCLDSSAFVRLANKNQLFAEVGHPRLDDHVDPRIKLRRQYELHPGRVAAQIHVREVHHDFLGCELIPFGPHQNLINELDMSKALWVAPRLIMNVDGELTDIITYDLVPQ